MIERMGPAGPLVLRYTNTDTGLKVYWNWEVIGSFVQGKAGESVLVMKDGTAVRLSNGEAAELAAQLDSLIDPPTLQAWPDGKPVEGDEGLRRLPLIADLVDAVFSELDDRADAEMSRFDQEVQDDIRSCLGMRFDTLLKEWK